MFLQLQDNTVSGSEQLLSQNAFGYVLPITSFVVAWLETWFLDFKVLTQEADDERGESGSDRDRTGAPPDRSATGPERHTCDHISFFTCSLFSSSECSL